MSYHCEKPKEACKLCRHNRFNENTENHECFEAEDMAKRMMNRIRQNVQRMPR